MNKKKIAAALSNSEKYKTLPQVTALGKGPIAENIVEKAQKHNVPIVEDSSLVEDRKSVV